jgi:hypothetical protein
MKLIKKRNIKYTHPKNDDDECIVVLNTCIYIVIGYLVITIPLIILCYLYTR